MFDEANFSSDTKKFYNPYLKLAYLLEASLSIADLHGILKKAGDFLVGEKCKYY